MFYSSDVSEVFLQSIFKLNDENSKKRITTRDNDNVQFHDKRKSKMNSTITTNSGAHTLTPNNKKSPYNKDNVATIKTNKILAKILLLGLVE